MLQSWGANLFYMPLGLTVDPEGNIWVTDVGLQQALKFSPSGKLLQSLGQLLEPGSTEDQFCKPTHVSVELGGWAALMLAALNHPWHTSCAALNWQAACREWGRLLPDVPVLLPPADTAPRCNVSHLHATRAPGHLTGMQGSAQEAC